MLQPFEPQPLEYLLKIFRERELKYKNQIQTLKTKLRKLYEQIQQLKDENYQLKWENSELKDQIIEFQYLPSRYSSDGDANCNWSDD
ncbi:hypothetical protein [Trichormus sp. NMC-1]|uniref:hypothetical protein n=1 Tax=Trichormus sp. NMC-1 TaxID=1853259 RepID=UPI0008DBFAA1|nr:hypothetical protein [Trichormus sp. NMC-1]